MKLLVFGSAALMATLTGCASNVTVYDTEHGWFHERDESVPVCPDPTVDFAMTSAIGAVGAFAVEKVFNTTRRETGNCIEREVHPDHQ